MTMSLPRLLFREIRHGLPSFLLGALAVAVATALFISLTVAGRASYTETKRLMRDIGFNLVIVPAETEKARFWVDDMPQGDMPEAHVPALAATPGIGADHYVAMLQEKITWRGTEALLTGILPRMQAVDQSSKAPMGYGELGRGACYLGSALGERAGAQAGDVVDVLGVSLRVERVLLEEGSKEDIRLYAHLQDVQQMLGREGRINTIIALNCLCPYPGDQERALAEMRRRIARVLPDVHVMELRNIALVRLETRLMAERYADAILGAVLAAAAAWVALLAMLNARGRRREIGVMRALGFGAGHIAALMLGRAALMGVLGVLVGFALGTLIVLEHGPEMFRVTFKSPRPPWELLVPSMLVGPLLAALAAFIPTAAAVTQDPASTLSEE